MVRRHSAAIGTVPGIDIQIAGIVQAQGQSEAWRDLAERALERNPFHEPAFALAAARHLREGHRPHFVFLWRSDMPRTAPHALLGVIPLAVPRSRLLPLPVRGWCHRHAVLGSPLIDASHAYETISVFLSWLGDALPRAVAIVFPDMAEDGQVASTVRAVTVATGRTVVRLGEHRRAVLHRGEDFDAFTRRALSGKKRKELARLRRRLSDRGEVRVLTARTPAEIREACEQYLVLEAGGWKGRADTAFIRSASETAFLRSVTRGLAHEGNCRIDLLQVGGETIAAGIVIGSQGRALYWKTTFDESFAAYSPGVLLTLAITDRQLAAGGADVTDSCAVADHPMINAIWPDRTPIADWMITLRPKDSLSVRATVASQRLAQGLTSKARTLVRLLRP